MSLPEEIPARSMRDDLFLRGGGEMGALIRSFDWSKTPVGPLHTWPQSLRTALGICLCSRFPMAIWWGPEIVQFYNDGYRPFLGAKHPRSMGQRGDECWEEIWDVCGPLYRHVMTTGESTWSADLQLLMDRNGYVEETYFTFAYSPIRGEKGDVLGNLITVTETTERVIGERRLKTLRDLGAMATAAKAPNEACRIAADILAGASGDIPFAALYLLEAEGRQARLFGVAGIERGTQASPETIDLAATDDTVWPISRVVASRQRVVVEDLSRFGPLPTGPWADPPLAAMVLPLMTADGMVGALVAGISPRRALDDAYRGFVDLLAGQIATGVANARAYEQERCRAEALAELDRAKTAFFSNVSHEFRTPLTLMLGPLEDELRERPGTPRLEMAHRNSLRLLRLVNALLDFSRLEAGRMQAYFEPTDLASFTAGLASVFRSAMEKAGLRLVVDCPPLPDPVYVDRDMWEKIVLNLLSNAFKFTFEGAVTITLRPDGDQVELSVADTGVGIAAEHIPHLFERFYRVEHTLSRTHEGSGIGLASVQELVRLHGGTVRVESRIGEGSVFLVTMPVGTAHLPADRIRAGPACRQEARGTASFVQEALRWLPNTEGNEELERRNEGRESVQSTFHTPHSFIEPQPKPRVLVVDDNADMRDYVRRLLAERYEVTVAVDGEAALVATKRSRPDLVLADVMMPRLDGFGLLRGLRGDPDTKSIPVIMLSARAGEESRVEGLEHGADDYLIKPFSARELTARVDAHLEMARVRRSAEEELRASEARFRAFADNAPAMLWVTESDGSCSFLSRGWSEFTGQTERDGLGFGWLNAVHPDDRAASREGICMAAAKREAFALEHRLRRSDGEYRWVMDAGRPRFGLNGAFLGYIGSVLDITERKQTEEALRKSEERLRAFAGLLEGLVQERTQELVASQERLRALTTELNLTEQRERRHLATELHDYLAQLLALSKIKLSHAKQQAMSAALSAALDGTQDILNRALAYTRSLVAQLSPPVLHEFGLPSALKWLADQMKERDLTVSLDMKQDMAPLPEDQAVLLFQSVRELLLNVVKHGRTNEAKVSVIEAEGILRIAVTDQGAGFDLAAPRGSSMSGFGLFSIRERMIALGGRFDLVSRPGDGTQATLILPLAPKEKSTESKVLSAELPGSAESRMPSAQSAHSALRTEHSALQKNAFIRVLLADDHAMVRQGLRNLLDAYAEIQVVGEAANGEEAVVMTEQLQPDVVLMDVNMPKMDGLQATRRIKQERPAAVVIGLSVQHNDDVKAAMKEAGAVAFLNKEAAVEQLYQTIQAMRKMALI